MLRDDIELYSELSGNDGQHTAIGIIGAYLDGYEKGRASADVPQWIPCKKRPPEIPIRVQVQLDNSWIITAYYDDGEWYSVPGDDEPINGVLAWRLLPEPYIEEQ